MTVSHDEALAGARLALKKLTVLRDLLTGDEGSPLVLMEELLAALAVSPPAPEHILTVYHQLTGKLLEHNLQTPFAPLGNLWQDYLLDRLLLLENPFTRQSSQNGWEKLAPVVVKAATEDLAALQELYQLGAGLLVDTIKEKMAANFDASWPADWQPPAWQLRQAGAATQGGSLGCATEVKQSFHQEAHWEKLLEPLTFYYRTVGTGHFTYCHAFRFESKGHKPLLKGITTLDPLRLDDLVGCELQIARVVGNTEQFLQGFPANNLLLYGERGTGKSSTIKALVHEYGGQGLRMIELTKEDLTALPDLLSLIRRRPHRFIIFIDDLSFEEGEVDYKHLKAVLEGSLEARPHNVLIYATSNRRHLIRERFSDREFTGDQEVRAQDTLQEKLSLADRFGMTITFTSPDQEQYLQIVSALAAQAGLDLDPQLLREEALKWALWHNGRSGRTARQFIDDLTGRLGMEAGGNH